MAQWTDEETLKLIEIWSEDKIQEELDGCKKNKHIYDKIAVRRNRTSLRAGPEQLLHIHDGVSAGVRSSFEFTHAYRAYFHLRSTPLI